MPKRIEAIAYAVIQIEGTTLGTATDTAGFYSLSRLPESRPITAVASAVGYDRQKQTVAIIAGQQTRLDFKLRSTAIMEQIVVTADRQATKRTEAPTVVNVLSSKLFDQTSSGNIADALGYVSGLRMEYTCSNCGTSQIRINGLEGQYSQILLDSRPVFSSLAAVYGLEQLPAGMVDRVEVIRGGGSALYGSNAIAGVVNIITKEPHRNSVSLANTTGFTESGTADVNTSLNASMLSDDRRAGAYLFASVRNRDNYDRNDDGFSDIPKVASQIAGFRAYYKTGAYSKLTFEYHHINDFRRGRRPPRTAAPRIGYHRAGPPLDQRRRPSIRPLHAEPTPQNRSVRLLSGRAERKAATERTKIRTPTAKRPTTRLWRARSIPTGCTSSCSCRPT